MFVDLGSFILLSDADIPLDMGVVSCNSPETTRANTPTQEVVSSSQSTPPPKKNKVGQIESYQRS